MSSVNWMKMTMQRAGSMNIHLGNKERIEIEHSNKHIDKSLSYLNSTIGCNDYSEAYQAMRERTKAVDAVQPPQRKVKDRVVACMLEIPCPLQIQEQGKDEEFFQTMYKTMQDYFGAENVHGAFIHRDEQHTYTGKDGQEYTSLYHAHVLVSAYTPEKGINGKAFETRKRLNEFNKLCDRTCEREFGIPLNTGNLPGKVSVEQLKAREEYHQQIKLNKEKQIEAEAIALKTELLKQQNDQEQQRRDNMGQSWKATLTDRVTMSKSAYEEVLETSKGFDQHEQDLIQREQDLNTRKQGLDQREQDLNQWVAREKAAIEQQNRDLRERQDKLVAIELDVNKVIDHRVQERLEPVKADYEKRLAQKDELIKQQGIQLTKAQNYMESTVIYENEYMHRGHKYTAEVTLADIYKEQRDNKELSYNDALQAVLDKNIRIIEHEIDKAIGRNNVR